MSWADVVDQQHKQPAKAIAMHGQVVPLWDCQAVLCGCKGVYQALVSQWQAEPQQDCLEAESELLHDQ